LDTILTPLTPQASQLEINGPQISLPAEVTVPFGLILHELATNATKYGAWINDRGRVVIQWQRTADQQLRFSWREETNFPLTSRGTEGLGTRVIKKALPQAKVNYDLEPGGIQYTIELPC
jgi:two-component system, chemotaxis family, CheB/CheR fusion protein